MLSRNMQGARKARGMTQEELALSIGITASSISMYEAGTRIPNAMVLKEICKCLDASADDMLGLRNVSRAPACRDDLSEVLGRFPGLSDEARDYILMQFDLWAGRK